MPCHRQTLAELYHEIEVEVEVDQGAWVEEVYSLWYRIAMEMQANQSTKKPCHGRGSGPEVVRGEIQASVKRIDRHTLGLHFYRAILSDGGVVGDVPLSEALAALEKETIQVQGGL